MSIELTTWQQFNGPIVVEVHLDDGATYRREFDPLSDGDFRALRVAESKQRRIDAISHLCLADEQKRAAIVTEWTLLIEYLFPELHHDTRLPE